MLEFKNIERNWRLITSRNVYTKESADQEASSIQGRIICLIHTFATPLKALSGLGCLALTITDTARIILGVLTLNTHPKKLGQAIVNLIDVPVGALLLSVALTANVIRGIVGTIFNPGIMIRHVDMRNDHTMTKHNILYGTLINYSLD
jgi:hypothetical protein